MKTRKRQIRKKIIDENYVAQINWDWLFLKGQMIFAGILFLGLIVFFLWFIQ